MNPKAFFRRFQVGFYFLASCGLLFGLTRSSYRAKELLACWLFFCSCFAAIVLLLVGGVLATFAGHLLVKWLSKVKLAIPELAVALVEVSKGHAPVPVILAAATLEFSVVPCAPVGAVHSASNLLVEAAPLSAKPFSEENVSN
jgi:hypothetical protein